MTTARSLEGLTSKIYALVDTNGLPVRLAVTAGEAHDNRQRAGRARVPQIARPPVTISKRR